MDDYSIVAVYNIPNTFDAFSLREYFEYFINSNSFNLFHFKNRPESSLRDIVKDYFQIDLVPARTKVLNKSSNLDGTKTFDFQSFETQTDSNVEEIEIIPPNTKSCFIKVKASHLEDLLSLHKTPWEKRQTGSSEQLCYVTSLCKGPHDALSNKCEEFHPPIGLPQGNVGTADRDLLKLLRQDGLLSDLFVDKIRVRNPTIYTWARPDPDPCLHGSNTTSSCEFMFVYNIPHNYEEKHVTSFFRAAISSGILCELVYLKRPTSNLVQFLADNYPQYPTITSTSDAGHPVEEATGDAALCTDTDADPADGTVTKATDEFDLYPFSCEMKARKESRCCLVRVQRSHSVQFFRRYDGRQWEAGEHFGDQQRGTTASSCCSLLKIKTDDTSPLVFLSEWRLRASACAPDWHHGKHKHESQQRVKELYLALQSKRLLSVGCHERLTRLIQQWPGTSATICYQPKNSISKRPPPPGEVQGTRGARFAEIPPPSALLGKRRRQRTKEERPPARRRTGPSGDTVDTNTVDNNTVEDQTESTNLVYNSRNGPKRSGEHGIVAVDEMANVVPATAAAGSTGAVSSMSTGGPANAVDCSAGASSTSTGHLTARVRGDPRSNNSRNAALASSRRRKQNKAKRKKKKDKQEAENMGGAEDDESSEDGAGVEEWERSEAFRDTIEEKRASKELRYEDEIEQVWEKGGSGLNFYTDAVFWRALEGDFDERNTDEWDVDFQAYYGGAPGDYDAECRQDMDRMDRLRAGGDETCFAPRRKEHTTTRRQRQHGTSTRQQGTTTSATPFIAPCRQSADAVRRRMLVNLRVDDEPVPETRTARRKANKARREPPATIGEFERHTRGVGRRLMESQGWEEGRGLGRGGEGRPRIVDASWRNPWNKEGLGFQESQPCWIPSRETPDVTTGAKGNTITDAKYGLFVPTPIIYTSSNCSTDDGAATTSACTPPAAASSTVGSSAGAGTESSRQSVAAVLSQLQQQYDDSEEELSS